MSDPSSTRTSTLPTADLGRGGPIVSRLALGTMTFGVETDEADAHRQLDTFVDAGGTLIDTADVYADGESERIVGRWAAARGGVDDPVVATKGRFAPPPGSHGASRRTLVRSVDASLRRLGTDAIDLYHVHGWDVHTPVHETLDTPGSLVRAGKIHDIGWSTVTGRQLQQILSTAELGGYSEAFRPASADRGRRPALAVVAAIRTRQSLPVRPDRAGPADARELSPAGGPDGGTLARQRSSGVRPPQTASSRIAASAGRCVRISAASSPSSECGNLIQRSVSCRK